MVKQIDPMLDYVIEHRRNYSHDELRAALLKQGHFEADIDSALETVGRLSPPVLTARERRHRHMFAAALAGVATAAALALLTLAVLLFLRS